MWISVSSRSNTRQYLLSPYATGYKNGDETTGKFVKLFGNVAAVTLAIADAFRIANGFFPVSLVCPFVVDFVIYLVSLRLPADLAPAPKTGPLSCQLWFFK